MRVEATVFSVSWVPSESLTGALRAGMDLGVSHWDAPPPERIENVEAIHELNRQDRFRWANVLSAWAEVDDDLVVDAGFTDDAGLVMGSTTVRLGPLGATFRAARLPVLQRSRLDGGSAVLEQTVGGRTGAPLPRRVPRPPYLRWQAPIVWTTLRLTIAGDGSARVELPGASAFPRHWVYGADGALALKSGLTDQARWTAHSFGSRTPWGDSDREAIVMAVESDLERLVSSRIMRTRPFVRQLNAGETLLRQGEPGDDLLLLLLDGVVQVDVDGRMLAELGPGAILGERALTEGGVRTATVTAATPVRVAVAGADVVDVDRLQELGRGRRREEQAPAS